MSSRVTHTAACAARSMRALISQTDDETIQDWRDTNRWIELARAWRKADSTRTEDEAKRGTR